MQNVLLYEYVIKLKFKGECRLKMVDPYLIIQITIAKLAD